MNAAESELLKKLNSFRFESAPVAFSFVDRLASENRWRLTYADRVIQEYKHFLFLAMTAGHPVSPSDPVDQAWHQHLLYSRSYWDDLCKNILGRPLHHGPTLGGPTEQVKHHDWYQNTLDSYRRMLQQEPPQDIWPTAEQLQQTHSEYQRVDVRKYWLIPKFRLLAWSRSKQRLEEH